MNLILLLERVAVLSVEILFLLMMARALLSFLLPETTNPLVSFIFGVTEFVITPLRLLCDNRGWFQNSFLDVPFLLTTLVLWLLELLFSLVGAA